MAVNLLHKSLYYPFGMVMSERSYSYTSKGYRFGFQGQERDDEIVGDGDYLAFKYRIHDARLGRFLSVDPLAPEYAFNSPYAFSQNRVIDAIELEGLEAFKVWAPGLNWSTKIKPATSWEIRQATIGVSIIYPRAAYSVGSVERGGTNISSVSGRIARHVAEDNNMSVDIGSERNAFRHVLWQATITNRFGERIATKIGNAHEGVKWGGEVAVCFCEDLIQDKMLADQIVDALNNEIGREIASDLGEDASQVDIAKAVLKNQREEGFYVVNEADDGTLSVSRSKITEAQYNKALKALEGLDDNGMSEQDRKDLEDD